MNKILVLFVMVLFLTACASDASAQSPLFDEHGNMLAKPQEETPMLSGLFGETVYGDPYGAGAECEIPPLDVYYVVDFDFAGSDMGWKFVRWNDCDGYIWKP